MSHSPKYILKEEIKHRLDRLDKEYRDPSIERSQRFKNINILENKLAAQLKSYLHDRNTLNGRIKTARDQLKKVQKEREELGNEQETIITEHALLRYLQRHGGIDIEEVHEAILKLPKDCLIKSGNTIVTVYPVPGEHIDEEDILQNGRATPRF